MYQYYEGFGVNTITQLVIEDPENWDGIIFINICIEYIISNSRSNKKVFVI